MTEPRLYVGLDLVKSWREDLHPRETHGKFTAVKGGSRVVTKNGKAGVVQEAGAQHKIRYDDGKLGTVSRDNVLHENDFKKVTEAKKKAEAKAKRDKAAASKSAATKTANRTNANGKTGAAKLVIDPTAKRSAPKEEKRRVPKSERDVSIPKSKLKRDMEAPVLKRNTTHDEKSGVQEVKQSIPKNPARAKEQPLDNDQNRGAKESAELPKERTAETTYIDGMWNSPEVQKIMSKPADKRSAEDIRKVAGEITTANDKLARHVVRKMADSRGVHVLGQSVLKRHMGAKRSSEGKKEAHANPNVRQDTGVHADLLQAARSSMYETLHNVLAGSQNPGHGTSMAAHVISRMQDKLHRDIYELMNDIPAPHEIRSAIGDMRNAEMSLTQKLGRTPSHKELADHLEANSKHFKEAPIVRPPHFDEDKGEWVNTNKRYEDPADKLRALKNYHDQQKTVSMDKNVGKADEREVSMADGMSERTGASPEQATVEKERQEELKEALPKAMQAVGLSDEEIKVLSVMHSQGSETGSKPNLTAEETSARLKDEHGLDINPKRVAYLRKTAMEKMGAAIASKHPAVEQLRMMKSLVANAILKSFYEYDLVKSLQGWGVDLSVLEQTYTRTLYADDKDELLKSMDPHEYVGSFVTLDGGDVIANLVEFTLPGDNELYKSFNAMRSGLRKSMFPHKGGGNHAVNEKAKAYVKSNSGKYKALSASQHSAASSKGKGGHTWSEELLLKNPGSCWITWGGKRILIHGTTGDVLYDSGNDAHREEHNQGAQEDKIDFHHEKEALDAHEEDREKAVHEGWKAHISDKEAKAGKSSNTLDYGKEREAYAKKHRGASFDEQGKLQFERDTALNEDNSHVFDHGVQAFRNQMEDMKSQWNGAGGHKEQFRAHSAHKALDVYSELSDEERAKLDGMGTDEAAKKEYLGKHFLSKDGVQEALQKYHDAYKSGVNPSEAEAEVRDVLKNLGSVAGRNTDMMTTFLKDVAKMPPSAEGNMDALAESFGTKEMSRAKEETNKKLIPEGTYMLGNPVKGTTMIVKIGGDFTGGRGSRKKDADGNEERGKYASVIAEAFDPEGGTHEDLTSWGQLGKALGYTGKDADNLKEILTQHANKDADKPFLKPISEEEFTKARAKTAAGLQDSMLHKEFKLVDQQRGKDGNLKGQTFAQKMPDGTTNHISVDAEGMIKDPLMQRLLNQRAPITNEADVNALLKNGVGKRTWVTAHAGGDIHIGDALGHHIQLEYDGKGAPRVAGGKYDGYRYIDQRDLPKGAIDPATGEPVKALFKNGKLVDRRFSTQNDVAMKEGNAVMFPDGDGKFKKGRIHSEENGTFKVTDGHGHVVGMFKKGELKPAKEEGRILSDSGQAVVKVAKTGTHRMTVGEAFAGEKPAAKAAFAEALRKAKVNKAFDEEGNLKDELELSDAMHRNLSKVLGRSKAGRAMLQKFNSAHTKELELHVPEHMRAQIEAEGVKVLNNGTARISTGKFEQLRDVLSKNQGGMSLTHEATKHMADYFSGKDRKPKKPEELKAAYQPSMVSTKSPEFDNHFKSQFKPSSYLMNKDQGLYGTQLEGVSHLVERGRGIAGHGMGTGKTILGVVAGLHYKADKLAKGEKPKKTLIVSPKGIMSDWGKEIGSHTNSKGLFIGSGLTSDKKSENGRAMWGQEGNEQEATDIKNFKKNSAQHASEDHDFHIVNYDTFMKHRDHFANSGMYDNMVIDEVHAFKNAKGARGTALAETTDKFKNVWGLSGTPMENDAREAHSLINTITGGKHELGNQKEFTDRYMQKDKNGKIVGIRTDWAPGTSEAAKGGYGSPAEKLGDIMANVIQFRGGEDVTYNDNTKIHFPSLEGSTHEDGSTPKTDFIGNMSDRNRDHKTNNYYGTKHSITDYEAEEKEVTSAKNGEKYTVTTTKPKNTSPTMDKMLQKYKELEAKYLPESKRNELATAAATGIDQGKKDGGNYLTAMQKLGKYLNAPLSHRIYAGADNAIDSDATDAQAAGKGKKDKGGLKQGEHYTVDKDGFKRYFESDGQGGYLKEKDGSPRLLPPLHKDNPKAQYLHDRIHKYLDSLQAENNARVKKGQTPMVPKLVVKSSFTTFGTDIIDNVLKDVRKSHPIFNDLHKQGFKDLGQGSFTGEATDREDTKVGFRGNKHAYEKNQGNLWATTVSPAGKEGVDFGNAHMMIHYDQDWNPQKMAQFTARVRRSDSAKTHAQMGRANSVRVESLHVPNTVEDFMFNAQDAKIKSVEQLTNSTRQAEKVPKLGDTESKVGYSNRGFTSRKQPRKPDGAVAPKKAPVMPGRGAGELPKRAAASADKALKLVILL